MFVFNVYSMVVQAGTYNKRAEHKLSDNNALPRGDLAH